MTSRYIFPQRLIHNSTFWDTSFKFEDDGCGSWEADVLADESAESDVRPVRRIRLLPLEAQRVLDAWRGSVLPGVDPGPLTGEMIHLLTDGNPTDKQLFLEGTRINGNF